MPLFETIVIGRCSRTSGSANLLRAVAIAIMKEGGNVRDMSILGDRILAKNVKGRDLKTHVIGRYMQIMFDGNDKCKKLAEDAIKESYETLRFSTHISKDYFSEAQLYKKSLKAQNLIVDEDVRNRDYVTELAALLQEKEAKQLNKERVADLSKQELNQKVWRHN